jgi:hypothetical protein
MDGWMDGWVSGWMDGEIKSSDTTGNRSQDRPTSICYPRPRCLIRIFSETVLNTQTYLQLTAQHIVFDAPTCFGHESQLSSGR